MRILVIDVGGRHVKVLATGHKQRIEFPSGPKMTAAKMVSAVRTDTVGWKYDAVSIGYPGAVVHGRPSERIGALLNCSRQDIVPRAALVPRGSE